MRQFPPKSHREWVVGAGLAWVPSDLTAQLAPRPALASGCCAAVVSKAAGIVERVPRLLAILQEADDRSLN